MKEENENEELLEELDEIEVMEELTEDEEKELEGGASKNPQLNHVIVRFNATIASERIKIVGQGWYVNKAFQKEESYNYSKGAVGSIVYYSASASPTATFYVMYSPSHRWSRVATVRKPTTRGGGSSGGGTRSF